MINNKKIIFLEKFFNNKKIIFSKLLSDSFGINCIKITTSDNRSYIVKYYYKSNNNFNAIISESKNLLYLNDLNLDFFPKIFKNNSENLIISYLNNNTAQPTKTKKDLLNAIISMHSIKDINYAS